MTSSIIGKSLIVAWSFTLSNLGPTPQIIDLGPAPTNSDYVPVEMIYRNAIVNDVTGLKLTLGTDSRNPDNVFVSPLYANAGSTNPVINAYADCPMAGNAIIPAGQDLYAEYSLPTTYSSQNKPIEIDVLAYPTN